MKLQAFKLLFVVLLTFSHDYGVEGWRRRRRRRWTPPPPRQCTVSGRKSASFSFTKTVLILFVLEMQFSKFVRVSYKILCPRARASISRLTLGRWKEVDRSLNHMHPLTEHPTAQRRTQASERFDSCDKISLLLQLFSNFLAILT